MNGRRGQVQRLGWLTGYAAGLGLIVLGAAWVGNFIEDDTLISLRYAQRLLEGNGLTWNDGERVEGYSNLAWVLGSAGLGFLGLDLILAVRVLAFACWAATLGALGMLARRLSVPWPAFAAVAIVFGATASVPVWAMGALEQPLVIACLSVALWALAEISARSDRPRGRLRAWSCVAGGALALLVWTRPDAPLLVVAVALSAFSLLWRSGPRNEAWTVAAFVVGLPLAAWLLQLGFRLAYYGEWLPNPAHIKAHTSFERVTAGLGYLGRGLGVAWLLSAVGALGAAMIAARRRNVAFGLATAGVALIWSAYVVAIGGDHFPAFRHLLVTQFCFAVLFLVGFSEAPTAAASRASVAALAVLVVMSVPYVWSQRRVADVNVARRARWQWDGQAVGETFARTFARQRPLWAVTAAGCLPYFSGLPALDLLGLNDAHIARQEPDARLPLAHDHGDGAYVLRRAPDLITFGLPRGGPPVYKSGSEMAADPSFARDYLRVPFRTLQPTSVLSDTYVRKRGLVGLSGSLIDSTGSQPNESLIIPAYLLRPSLGHPLPNDTMGAKLIRGRKTAVALPAIPAGRYRVVTEPENQHVALWVVSRSGPLLHPVPEEDGAFIASGPVELTLEARSPHVSTLLGSIRILRIGDAADGVDAGRPTLRLRKAAALSDRATAMGPWEVTGEAFSPGADAVTATGVRRSSPFEVSSGTWLSFRVAGGRAENHATQVGVRILDLTSDPPAVRAIFFGRNDDQLRPIRADLSFLAGRIARVEVFDDSERATIVAEELVLHE